MALFQKQPISDSAPLYTIGGSGPIVLIVGLGNPGRKYDGTRHNVGFAAVDEFATRNDFPAWTLKKDMNCHLSIKNLSAKRVILCKPYTYMNQSGQAAQAVQRFYRIYNPTTLAVYDELALPFGSLRSRVGGNDAGHNGVKSLIQHIGEDFGRLRIGIGSEQAAKRDAADFVLSQFSKAEQKQLPMILQEADVMIGEYVFNGQLPHDTRSIV